MENCKLSRQEEQVDGQWMNQFTEEDLILIASATWTPNYKEALVLTPLPQSTREKLNLGLMNHLTFQIQDEVIRLNFYFFNLWQLTRARLCIGHSHVYSPQLRTVNFSKHSLKPLTAHLQKPEQREGLRRNKTHLLLMLRVQNIKYLYDILLYLVQIDSINICISAFKILKTWEFKVNLLTCPKNNYISDFKPIVTHSKEDLWVCLLLNHWRLLLMYPLHQTHTKNK